MPKSISASNAILALIFNNKSWAGIAKFDGGPDLFVSFHSNAPVKGGKQSDNEASYEGYSRVAVKRSTLGWVEPYGGITSNASPIKFEQCTNGKQTITHLAVGTSKSGDGQILYVGALSDTIDISRLITPEIPIGAFEIMES